MGDDKNINTEMLDDGGSKVNDIDWEDEPVKEQTSSEKGFILKYLGETMTVDKDKAVELAQKGMDYDRIRRRYDTLKTTAYKERGDSKAVKRAMDIDEFMEDYPEIKPESIPNEVWQAVKHGRTLSEAYTKWENTRIKTEREAEAQQSAVAERALGSRISSPVRNSGDEFTRELLKV